MLIDSSLLPDISNDNEINNRAFMVTKMNEMKTHIEQLNKLDIKKLEFENYLHISEVLITLHTQYQAMLRLMRQNYKGFIGRFYRTPYLEGLYFRKFKQALATATAELADILYQLIETTAAIEHDMPHRAPMSFDNPAAIAPPVHSQHGEIALINSTSESFTHKIKACSFFQALALAKQLKQIAPAYYHKKANVIAKHLSSDAAHDPAMKSITTHFKLHNWKGDMVFIPNEVALSQHRKRPGFFYANHNFAHQFTLTHSCDVIQQLSVLDNKDDDAQVKASLTQLKNLLIPPPVKGLAYWFNPYKKRMDFLQAYKTVLIGKEFALFKKLALQLLATYHAQYPATYDELLRRNAAFSMKAELVEALFADIQPAIPEHDNRFARLQEISKHWQSCKAAVTTSLHLAKAGTKEQLLAQLNADTERLNTFLLTQLSLDETAIEADITAKLRALEAAKDYLQDNTLFDEAVLEPLFKIKHTHYLTQQSFLACLAKHTVASSLSPQFAWLKQEEKSSMLQQEEDVLKSHFNSDAEPIQAALNTLKERLTYPFDSKRYEALLNLINTELAKRMRSSDAYIEMLSNSQLRYDLISQASELPDCEARQDFIFMLKQICYCGLSHCLTQVESALTKPEFKPDNDLLKSTALNIIADTEKDKIRLALITTPYKGAPSAAYETLCAWAGCSGIKPAEPLPAVVSAPLLSEQDLASLSTHGLDVYGKLLVPEPDELLSLKIEASTLQQDFKSANPALRAQLLKLIERAKNISQQPDYTARLDEIRTLLEDNPKTILIL